MAVHNYTLTKSNALIEAGYFLTEQEYKLVACCIAKLDPRKDVPATSTISASEFSDWMNVPIKNAYRDLKFTARGLYDRSILISRSKTVDDESRWIDRRIMYHNGEGKITLHWSSLVKEHLGNLKANFTSIQLRHIGVLSGLYTVRIFELLMQFERTGARHISIDDLRFMLQIEDKYPAFRELTRRIIKPALAEINAKTNYNVIYQPVSQGRKIMALQFFFSENKQGKLDLD